MMTLNGIALPDGLVWRDLDYCAIKQDAKKSITGRTLLLRGREKDGRPITLTGTEQTAWLTRAQAVALSGLRTELDRLTFVVNGATYMVRFALHESDHFVVKPLWPDAPADQESDMYYIETIKLIEVLE